MSVVVPAYNEEERLPGMLEEAITFLEREYGSKASDGLANSNGVRRRRGEDANSEETGWEIIIVSDGSTDKTVETALDFARTHALSVNSPPAPGPRTPKPDHTTHISASRIRVVELEKNRGKGGAVIHGMRHVRGKYVIFADADGASKFEDLEKMVAKAKELEANDTAGRAVVVGSRAHLVGSEAVVKVRPAQVFRALSFFTLISLQRSLLRNVLMYSFHVFIRLLTTAKTSRIGDTQCGFKLFTRPALPHVVPYMHSEGWIFDVEMLMLTEAADIPMEEVHVGWKEIPGSKLNVIWASLGMAWGLVIMRGAWVTGIWKRV
jgi:dolichyl-phosphate beta-glucosyltransferase